jgi:LPS sulfotransferase NodH
MPRSPVFVAGMPRSGTTLLSTMLDAHPEISIAPETHFFTRSPAPLADASATVRDQTLEFLRAEPGVQDMNLSAEEWREIRRLAGPEARPVDLFAALVRTYAARTGAPVWGEKTPDHLAHLPDMAEAFPGAVFIVITRDPRDVYLSQQSMTWNRDTIVETAWTWRQYAMATVDYRSQYAGRFLDIQYEDLLRDPASNLSDICERLEVPFDRAMLDFYERADPAISAEPWKTKSRQPVDPTNTRKWRTRLSPARQWIIQWVAGRAMHAFGYPTPPVPVDGSFWKDALQLLAESAQILASRRAQKHGINFPPPKK